MVKLSLTEAEALAVGEMCEVAAKRADQLLPTRSLLEGVRDKIDYALDPDRLRPIPVLPGQIEL